nr:serine/threonine-protein kinase [Streptomyces scabichelini]
MPPGADDPESIGPYRVLGRLSTVGMGRVHVGRSPGGRLVAVKTLLAEGEVSDAARRRFAREVSLARRVGGPYTANVVDAAPDAERPWMATEFIPGPSLHDLVRLCGPLPSDAVLRVAAGAAEALHALHEAGVVHRDVKPGNILLPADGPRLIDFGISQATDITRTTLTLGTISYTSPEQARGEESTAASDVYSLGATLFHIATGRPPYRDTGDTLRLLGQVARGDLDLAGLPPELEPLVMRCLRDDPGQRPRPGELLDELAPVVAARQAATGGAPWLPPEWLRLIEAYETEVRALGERGPAVPDPRAPGRPGGGSDPADPAATAFPAPPSTPLPEPAAAPAVLASPAGDAPTRDLRAAPAPDPRLRVSGPPPRPFGRGPGGPGRRFSGVWWLVPPVVLSILAALIVLWVVPGRDNDSAAAGGSPATVTATATRTTENSPTPTSDPTARAFAAVRTGDCLDAYKNTFTGRWSAEMPKRVNCAAYEAHVKVTSTNKDDGTDCPRGPDRSHWLYDSGADTKILCLERQFSPARCFPARSSGDDVEGDLMASWDCDKGDQLALPYEFLMQMTGLNQGSSGDCSSDDGHRYWKWIVQGGEAHICAWRLPPGYPETKS